MRQVTPRQIHQRAAALTFQPRLRPDSRAGVARNECACASWDPYWVTRLNVKSAPPPPPVATGSLCEDVRAASASHGFESGVEDVYGH